MLRNALSNLQMVYVEVAQKAPGAAAPAPSPKSEQQPASAQTTAEEKPKASEPISTPPSDESESKKKFTKSYGP